MKLSAVRSLGLVMVWVTVVLASTFPFVQQEQAFLGNLHSHTSYSDGSGTPKEAYQRARNIAKLDFLALTEHNHAEAAGDDGISIATLAWLLS